MMTPEPDDLHVLRQAFDMARLGRLFPTPLQALADPVYGLILRAAYKHIVFYKRRRRPA